jgi:hypothetical protein
MATNKPYGDNARKGQVNDRSQTKHSDGEHWVKRDTETGRFMDVKTSSTEPFKGVKKEKK